MVKRNTTDESETTDDAPAVTTGEPAGSGPVTPDSVSPPEKHAKRIDKVVEEVFAGKWGKGQERRLRLAQAGFDHREVQRRIVARANQKR